jgi:putative hydroxymethylpyrimidine transport system substrate-binding protein
MSLGQNLPRNIYKKEMSMQRKLICLIVSFSIMLFSSLTFAEENKQTLKPFTVILDWFMNPDHAPLFVAEQQNFFAQHGLQVTFITPANADDPLKLLAAGKADIAINYQPNLLLTISRGFALQQVGTLIDKPLDALAVLADGPIKTIADLKGKRVASSSTAVDSVILKTMLEKNGLSLSDVELINVNYDLDQALLTQKVDAAIGLMRNFEPLQLAMAGHSARLFYPENNGFPTYDELIFVAQKQHARDPRIIAFLQAAQEGRNYLLEHPQASWQQFAHAYPENNNRLNQQAWLDTLPYFAKNPANVDSKKCQKLADFLIKSMQISIPKTACVY